MRYLGSDGVVPFLEEQEAVITPRQAQTLLRLANMFDQETGRIELLKRLLDTWEALSKMGMWGRIGLVVLAAAASLVMTITQIMAYLHQPRN